MCEVAETAPSVFGENYVCSECRLAYADVPVERAVETIGTTHAMLQEAVAQFPAESWTRRPADGGWSITEYVCHVRDVYVTYTIRLYRARTEERPMVEPMFNDLRAQRFRYNECAATAILDEIELVAKGLCDEAARLQGSDWDRTVFRLPGEQRSGRWLVRQAMHEGLHHAADVGRVGRAVSSSASPGS